MAFKNMSKVLRKKSLIGVSGYYDPKDKNTILAYYISYRDLNGNPIKRKTDANTPEEAKKILEKIKEEIEKDKTTLSKENLEIKRSMALNRVTVDDLAKLFFENRTAKNNTKDKQAYTNRVSIILGAKRIDKITNDDLKTLSTFLEKKKNYSPKTINETYNLLRSMFNEGIKKKWCSNNPITDLEIKRAEESHEQGRVLSDDELEILFQTALEGSMELEIVPRPTLFLFMKFLYHTGARPQAVLEVKYQDIKINSNQIQLKAMKKGKAYTQEVNQSLMILIAKWIKEHDLKYGDYIFYPQQTYQRTKNPKDKQKPTIYENLRRGARIIFDKLFNQNIPIDDRMNRVSLYSFRRTSGTKIYKAKGIMEAMVFLNHTSVKTTQKYLNVENDIKGIADVL